MRKQKLPIVFSVDGLPTAGLLVLGVDQELVVHSLHHDLLRSVLAHVEPQLEFFAPGIVIVLDEGRLETLEPG